MSSSEIDWPTVGATIGHMIKAATAQPPEPRKPRYDAREYSMAFENLRVALRQLDDCGPGTMREGVRTDVIVAARTVLAGYDETLAEGIGR